MPRAFGVATTIIGILAVLGVVVLAQIQRPISSSEVGAVAFLCSVAVFAFFLKFQLPHGAAHGTVAFVPLVSTIFVSPSYVAPAGAAATMLVAELIRRKPPSKVLFNTAQAGLANCLAVLTFVMLGGESAFDTDRISILPALCAIAVHSLISNGSVAIGVSLLTRKRVSDILRGNAISTLGYDVLVGPLVVMLAWVYAKWGIAPSAVVAALLLGAHHLYLQNQLLAVNARELLELMVKAIEARDPYTSGHSRRVSYMATVIARSLNLSDSEVKRISVAGLLHDVGKIHEKYAPILRKPDRLTPSEWAIIREHPGDGAELVATVSQLKDIVSVVRHHHENWDGTGYPDGLAGAAIPLRARIVMFADTIDAMTSDRPYRRGLTMQEVREEILRGSGSQFDPEIAAALLGSRHFETLFHPVAAVADARYGLERVPA